MFDESLEESWKLRYGKPAPSGLPPVDRFLAHRSVRQYKPDLIPESTIQALFAAAQSASTSSNLMLWSAVSIQEASNRAAIAHLCADQKHVLDAPWFFAFLVDHHRIRKAANAIGEEAKGLDYLEFMLMGAIDAALAAERMVCAAESIGIGSCYIGALRNDVSGVKKALSLPSGVLPVFGLSLGYPDETARATIKPRLASGSVWFRESYDLEAGIGDYDERAMEFYRAEGAKQDLSWSQRSGRRVGEGSLTGRDALMPFALEQGFNKR